MPRECIRLPYHKLQAFDTNSARGWGVRSATAISEGVIVLEVVGRAMSEEDFEGLDDLEYVVGFDDRTMAAKRRLGDTLSYIDCRKSPPSVAAYPPYSSHLADSYTNSLWHAGEHGNLMRLVNDDEEAPNLQMIYWAPPDEALGVMPRRIYLMAKHDIPPGVELTFNYGKHYDRHWQKETSPELRESASGQPTSKQEASKHRKSDSEESWDGGEEDGSGSERGGPGSERDGSGSESDGGEERVGKGLTSTAACAVGKAKRRLKRRAKRRANASSTQELADIVPLMEF